MRIISVEKFKLEGQKVPTGHGDRKRKKVESKFNQRYTLDTLIVPIQYNVGGKECTSQVPADAVLVLAPYLLCPKSGCKKYL